MKRFLEILKTLGRIAIFTLGAISLFLMGMCFMVADDLAREALTVSFVAGGCIGGVFMDVLHGE